MQSMSPEQFMKHLQKTGAFDTEEAGFAQEAALQYGFEYIDDDATQMKCTTFQLFALMKALGYRRIAIERPAVVVTNRD